MSIDDEKVTLSLLASIIVLVAQGGPAPAIASKECSEAIQASQTAADLEKEVIGCLKAHVSGSEVREALQRKRSALLAHRESISGFISHISASSNRMAGERGGLKRTSYLSSITAPGIKPYIFHIGIESKSDGEIVNILLEISDRPI